ncbi:DNA-directed RNA polymerase III RPC2 [Toxoplasma gondii GAB2-2007-GAL-DOM2]|uniref:DNA-directed RNA polymerase subunit beta n=5 Tax=Toxoplasma gondii TaxID=5811 RepID=S7WCA7_TOXGG|nr:DNA-directed RNA polymerase III RPC2 [Toxoplasma gondii GT1]KAF4642086.1 DNA-directed RNA polymerase III RPC2 [Toxoplasma gondii]KFG43088.1 DNA-directed RNA polymerase III RPC2 [Toxoplasma gondii GAB2-2007-GAL-DOM2]
MESRCSPSVEMTGKKRVAPAPAAVVAGEVDPLASLSPRLGGLKNWRDTTQNESEKTSGDASASSPSSSTRLRFPYGASVPSDRRIPYCRPPGGRSSASSRPSSSPSAAPSAVPSASPASLETREEGGRAKKSVRFASFPKKSADSSSSCNATVADPYASGKPVCTVPDKWRLLPAFFAAKGLVHQHIESYNFFVDTELQNILRAPSNRLVKSDVDPSFFIEFLNISVGTPRYEEGMILQRLTPRICRTREITYAAPVFVDAEYSKGDEIIRRKHVEIGSIPVMLRSRVCVLHGKDPQTLQRLGECPFDPGGYFIVKGTEKVLLMQEQLSKNRIIVETDMKHNVCATVTSATAESKSRTAVVLKNNKLYLRHNSFLDDLPACIVLRAMGTETDQEIMQMIGAGGALADVTGNTAQEAVSLSLQDCHTENVLTQQQALLWVGSRIRPKMQAKGFFTPVARGALLSERGGAGRSAKSVVDEAVDVLHRVVLSHIETTGSDFRAKTRFLCLMIRRVLDAASDPSLMDDKDYYGNKRLELAGQLLSLLFEDLFKRFCTHVKKQADYALSRYHQARGGAGGLGSRKDEVPYPDCFRNLPTDIITRGMQTALSTGNWTIKRFRMERSGVSQVLSRLSYIATLGMMTRINSQFEKGRKVSGPRALQPSQWGMLCPCDTPEGESCGLVKNLALVTHVTTDEDPTPISSLAFCLGVEDADAISGEELHDRGTYLVMLNGALLGVHRRPRQLMKNIRLLRRHGEVGEFVSVHVNEAHKTVYIASDGGRLCRPLIVVDSGRPRLLPTHMAQLENGEMCFMDLLRSSILEWIDVNEENNLLIALREEDITAETTHLEIDPLTLLGVVAGLIAFPNHNQSPRNTYQCAMGKQAMGAIAYNQFNRCDTLLYLLVYPQKPLCKSRTLDLVHFEQLPAGQNASVAIMSFSGYDIEDAIVLNRGAVDRGFGRCFALRRYSVELKKYFNGSTDRTFPPPVAQASGPGSGKAASGLHRKSFFPGGRGAVSRRFEALEDDGVVRVGELLEEDQVYVHKFSPTNTREHVSDPLQLDNSLYAPSFARYKTVVPSYVERVVCTDNSDGCRTYKVMMRQTRLPELGDKFSSRHGQKGVVGLIAPAEDLPFAESGWCPDLIMNPHGFPSRMTVGKMMELIAGKSALQVGACQYGTAFGGVGVETLGEILAAHGFHYSGKEYLTSGITGEALQTYVFAGPIYYQKLKHMVQDKIHARGRGPRQLLTRQPTEGRAKEGGLRLGEMERDCLVAYGSSALLMERLMLSSDVFEASVCSTCGLMGYEGWCPYCKSGKHVAPIRMPYACKLLFQELMSMNVCPRLHIKEM